MEYRKLGKTGLDVSMISLGTEYLNEVPRETVVSVVHEAVDRGVNYIDLFFAHAEIRDNFGVALKGRRDKVMIAGHLGAAAEDDGQYYKTRDRDVCEKFFLDLAPRLHTDYIDILMLHNVDTGEEYKEMLEKSLDIAQRYQKEGKVRYIALSGHNPQVSIKAVKSGLIDILMYPINLTGEAMPGRKELLNTCVSEGVGLVAMKPYAGGKLLQKSGSASIEHYQSGWKKYRRQIPSVTPVQCVSYALSQIGVSTIVPGVKNNDELKAALRFLDATDEEKDFSSVIPDFKEYVEGECVYCNHCLPCPSVIDIGKTIRLLEIAQYSMSDDIRDAYKVLPKKASDCVECGSCMERCPFGVDVISKMQQAVKLFEEG